MLWIVLSIITLMGSVGAVYVRGKLDPNGRDTPTLKRISLGGQVIMIVLWALLTFYSIFHSLENGHVGLVYRFGAIVSQRGDGHGGLVLTAPWEELHQANVQVQALQPSTDCYNGRYKGCMEGFTQETQDVFVSATINVHVDPQNIQGLYRQVGPDYILKLVLPRIDQITKEETARYAATDLAPKRKELRDTIASRLTNELSARSIVVDDFLVTNVDFRDEFKQAIEEKVRAEQDTQTEKNKVQVEVQKALQEEQRGIAVANKTREEAKGQADANRELSASLTPQVIQFQAVQKLGDKIQIALIPSGQGVIIDPATLFGMANP